MAPRASSPPRPGSAGDGSGERRRPSVLVQALRSCGRTVRLLAEGRLHLRPDRRGAKAELPDGRRFVVFRESSCDAPTAAAPVTLAVWFHLRGLPPGGRIRRRLFERLCLVNTFLFSGFAGYRVKLWMVDPRTADYAGLYTWRSAVEAESYGDFITRVLTPVSTTGSVGYEVLPGTLEDYLVTGGGSEITPRPAGGSADRTPRRG